MSLKEPKPKSGDRVQDAFRVCFSGIQPDVQIAGIARVAVNAYSIAADDHVLRIMLFEQRDKLFEVFAQHVWGP